MSWKTNNFVTVLFYFAEKNNKIQVFGNNIDFACKFHVSYCWSGSCFSFVIILAPVDGKNKRFVLNNFKILKFTIVISDAVYINNNLSYEFMYFIFYVVKCSIKHKVDGKYHDWNNWTIFLHEWIFYFEFTLLKNYYIYFEMVSIWKMWKYFLTNIRSCTGTNMAKTTFEDYDRVPDTK